MSSSPRSIVVIVASTRTTRFADHPLNWVLDLADTAPGLQFSVVDLRDHQLPYYDLPIPPAMAPRKYSSDEERELGEKLDAADGFLIITNEYNHGYTAGLKNVLDHFMAEFGHKPVAFVGYGNVGGARAIEQLRQVVVELDMVPVKHAVHIAGAEVMAIRGGASASEAFASQVARLELLFANLEWWANATAAARALEAAGDDAA